MPSASQPEIWNDVVGDAWVTHATHYDATLEPFGEAVVARLTLRPGDRVVDVGCGTGATTVRLAALVAPGAVTGLDVSAPMLTAASSRAAAAGAANVTFAEVDIEAAPFGSAAFDVAFSRFGVMFFADAARAFSHIHGSLVEGGRLGFVCFQAPSANPFITVPVSAANAVLGVAPQSPDGPSPFSMADPDRTRSMLSGAGFTDVVIESGPAQGVLGDTDDMDGLARRLVEQNPTVGPVMAAASPATRERVIAATVAALEPYHVDGRVALGAASWVVTATAAG